LEADAINTAMQKPAIWLSIGSKNQGIRAFIPCPYKHQTLAIVQGFGNLKEKIKGDAVHMKKLQSPLKRKPANSLGDGDVFSGPTHGCRRINIR
jgi:hypothetical protein